VILVCGEALIDLTQTAEAGVWRAHPAGSPLNVAVGLARLGCPTAFLGRLSRDVFGRQLRARLADNDVDERFVVDAAEPTSLAVIDVDADGVASYVFHMSGTADWQWSPDELPGLGGLTAVHTGSLALLQPPGGAVLETWLAGCRGRVPVSIDPNIRPSVQSDRDAYRRAVDRWLGLADVFKASREDVAFLYPGEPVEAVAQRWLEAGPRLVAITLGPDGAHVATAAGTADVPGRAVNVVDTVGAGDAFTSGLLQHLHSAGLLTTEALARLDLQDATAAVAFAVRVAADTCTRAGAEPPREPPS
jgi:fructokinase